MSSTAGTTTTTTTTSINNNNNNNNNNYFEELRSSKYDIGIKKYSNQSSDNNDNNNNNNSNTFSSTIKFNNVIIKDGDESSIETAIAGAGEGKIIRIIIVNISCYNTSSRTQINYCISLCTNSIDIIVFRSLLLLLL